MAADAPRNILHHGEALASLAALPDDSIDSIVTDPPYGLSKEPDMAEVLKHWLAGDDYTHQGGGFMGKSWDSFVPGPATWRAAYAALKPGGYMLVFAGTRTIGLMETAIRLAGFEIRDTMMWLYGCLTDDVEVLTERGWKLGIEVREGDRVAQWDDGTITLAKVAETYRAPWDGDMVVFRNHDTDQVLTPNHRVYHQPRQRRQEQGKRRSWYESRWRVAEASEISRSTPVRLPMAGHHDGPGIGGTDYAALLGWVWTEGGFDLSGSGVRIYQSSVNQADVDEIDALVSRQTIAKRYERERSYAYADGERTYVETTWFITGEFANCIRRDLPGKRPTYELLWRMTEAEKLAFMEAALRGDGSEHAKPGQCPSRTFFQKHEDDLVWFQTLLALVGQRGKVSMRKPPREGGSVSITPRATTELQHRHLRDATEHYQGEVWCVRVPSGAFVARRNGKVFVTGNSGFPKSMDVSKAIDKRQMADGVRVGEWIKSLGPRDEVAEVAGVTPRQVDHWVGESTPCPQFPTAERFAVLCAHYGQVPDWAEAMYPKAGELLGVQVHSRSGGDDFGKVVGTEAVQAREVEVFDHGTVEAEQWDGWGTALKPAWEPIIVARKPLSVNGRKATVAANVLAHGTGAINIDGCRVDAVGEKLGGGAESKTSSDQKGNEGWTRPWMDDPDAQEAHAERVRANVAKAEALGRFPANVMISHTEDCVQVGTKRVRSDGHYPKSRPGTTTITTEGHKGQGDLPESYTDGEVVEAWECVEDCPVRLLDTQSGVTTSTGGRTIKRSGGGNVGSGKASEAIVTNDDPGFGDRGGASRFFYSPKASKSERNEGLPGDPATDRFDGAEYVSVVCDEWESEAQRVVLRVATAPSRPRVTGVSGIAPSSATAWSTFLFGNEPTDQSRVDSKSTTETATSSTTTSRTLNFLMRSPTSAFTLDANSGMESGGGPADSAGSSSTSVSITSAETVCLPGVGAVPSGARLRLSVVAKPEYGTPEGEGVVNKSTHPTVKPVSLMRYLVRLVTPPGGLVLDPYCGSGTTLVAAIREGMDYIGIDKDPEGTYLPIANARRRHAEAQVSQHADTEAS